MPAAKALFHAQRTARWRKWHNSSKAIQLLASNIDYRFLGILQEKIVHVFLSNLGEILADSFLGNVALLERKDL